MKLNLNFMEPAPNLVGFNLNSEGTPEEMNIVVFGLIADLKLLTGI